MLALRNADSGKMQIIQHVKLSKVIGCKDAAPGGLQCLRQKDAVFMPRRVARYGVLPMLLLHLLPQIRDIGFGHKGVLLYCQHEA